MPDAPTHLAAVPALAPPLFACTSNVSGKDAAWIRATGEIDIATSPQLEQILADVQAQVRLVVLDLHELTFMDTCAVHVVVAASTHARVADGRLIVLRGPRGIPDTFDLTGMDGAIDSHRGGLRAVARRAR